MKNTVTLDLVVTFYKIKKGGKNIILNSLQKLVGCASRHIAAVVVSFSSQM